MIGGGFRLQLALHAQCATCERNVGNKSRDDVVEAVVFGTSSPFSICPACFQKPFGGGNDPEFRRRARVVLFERYGIVVRDGKAYRAKTGCPECGGEIYRTRMAVGPAGCHESAARETDVVACSACEYVEEEVGK